MSVGEKYMITYFDLLTFSKQGDHKVLLCHTTKCCHKGVYDVINNLGSLVPRFIFLPIEENFNVYYANNLYRGKPAREQSKVRKMILFDVITCRVLFITVE